MSHVFHHKIDREMLEEQRAAIEAHLSLKPRHILPITDPIKAEVDHPSSVFRGHTVGCIVMAGGQATRLGGTAPKGTIPFSPVSGKSLLQIIAEKVVAFSRCYGSIARLAIMTSEATDEATKTLFAAHHNFGINRVDFFLQSSRPLLDMDKNPITTSDGKLLTGPDGNGGVFREFVASGMLHRWEEEGIEALSVIMVDNPLIDPFCPAMFEPIFKGVDLSASAIERTDEKEQVGFFVQENGSLRVVEYSEIDPMLRSKRDINGRLLFRWANISSFACSLQFVKAAAKLPLPLHIAKKMIAEMAVWKAEYFIFDAMAAARTISIIPLERQSCFAPVKDLLSLEQSRRDMMARNRRRFAELTHTESDPEKPFELTATAFYPPSDVLHELRKSDLIENPS